MKKAFLLVYAILVLNFAIPAASYVVAPDLAIATLDRVNRALGGGPYPFTESSALWHMLGVGNVMTLAFMCALLMVDVRRFLPVLPALLFLKGWSAIHALVIGIAHHCPAFVAIFALDGTTTVAMLVFAIGAVQEDAIGRALETLRARQLVPLVPTRFQLLLGVARMQYRLLFRSETVGTSRTRAARRTLRARLFSWRAIRLPFLILEGAVAPLDLSGLASSRERILRHLLAAHHDADEMAYDLELLALHEGALAELERRARDVVTGRDPRAPWLRDLTVFDGYHEALLVMTERALAWEPILAPDRARDPDVSFFGYLAWCAAQPLTAREAIAAWRRGALQLA